jgi:N-acyl-phosphatidylethanolamine-hydrolysing phospholipase D
LDTLKELYAKHAERPPILFVGLKGAAGLRSTVGKKTEIVEMDWWEDRVVSVEGRGDVKVTCSESRGCLCRQ